MSDTNEVFDLDAHIAETRLSPFKFRWHGEIHELPHMSSLDADQALKAYEAGEAGLIALFRSMVDIKGMPVAGINQLLKRWQQHSGVELGESQASPH